MARKKATIKDESRPKVKSARKSGRSGGNLFFRIVISTPVRQIILVAVVVALLFWQWDNIETGLGSLVNLLGWGLAFIVAAVIVLIVLIWQRKLSLLFLRFNRWLGGIVFILAIWGVIAFFNKGGTFGRSIISFPAPEFIGVLRVLGLVIVGAFVFSPRTCFRAIANFFLWLGKQFERRPAPVKTARGESQSTLRELIRTRPSVTEKPPMLPEMQKPVMPPEVERPVISPGVIDARPQPATSGKKEAAPVTAEAQSQRDLRQVAQDVWKKYGQSPELVTVDGWRLPPIDILDVSPDIEFSEADNMQRAKLIEEALASYGVEAKVVQINAGPTVTQFGLEPGWDRKVREVKERDREGNIQVKQEEVSRTRVKVDRITSLANDMALALASPSIRIEAPVPGKSVVGIEVPNVTSNMVSLRGVVETGIYQKLMAKSKLALALGKGAGGETVASDLARMPHLLIAGATGSGKTVCLNTIICCLLLNNTPNDVRMIMIDPKRVELTPYNSIPHLAAPVIVDTKKALTVMRWLSKEMDERYQKLATAGARHIEGYNKDKHGDEKLPYLVLVIDELADLMMAGFDEVENILCRLAQLSRAVGIHLIVATQRPSVDVVTGLIKANFPTRISFAVTSQVDSRTILDGAGAEKLLGRGDMLFMPSDVAKPKRLQGCFLSDAEMERLVYFWGGQQREEMSQLKVEEIVVPVLAADVGNYPDDPLLEAAKELAGQHEHISTSFLQRRLHIGYPRAARIMEQLEEAMIAEKEAGSEAEGGEGEGV
ncbi:DNA translocase FtsK [Chloroflexota bacterium]